MKIYHPSLLTILGKRKVENNFRLISANTQIATYLILLPKDDLSCSLIEFLHNLLMSDDFLSVFLCSPFVSLLLCVLGPTMRLHHIPASVSCLYTELLGKIKVLYAGWLPRADFRHDGLIYSRRRWLISCMHTSGDLRPSLGNFVFRWFVDMCFIDE